MLRTWITDGSGKPFYFRQSFELKKEVKEAEALVCGLGQFVFYLNGRKVGDHELDPGWTDYRKYVQYVRFDVLPYLRQGENVAAAEVGNGWYLMMNDHYTFHFPPFMPPNPNPYRPFGEALVLAAEISVTYADGSTERFSADPSGRTAPHPVVMSNVYGSETIQAALTRDGWNAVGYDDSDWQPARLGTAPAGELSEQTQPPVKVIRTYEAKYLHQAGDRAIYDFGQNISGMLEFEIKGKAGTEVKFYVAEKLTADGDVDQMAKGWLPIDNCITYVIGADDVWETWRMKFTYFAGRYFAVAGAGPESQRADSSPACALAESQRADGSPAGALAGSQRADGSPAAALAEGQRADGSPAGALAEGQRAVLRRMRGHAITSAYTEAGHFSCDDRRYEQIYDLVEKAVEANMLSVHTDCPTIERFAWQEPNHLMAPSIMYMKDVRLLWEKFLKDMRAGQHTAADRFRDYDGNEFCPGDGLMPSQAPCYIPNAIPVPGMGSFYDIIPWGSTCILGTYWHYQFYGDRRIIEDNYDAGMRYLNYLKTKVTKEGFINHGLGDWGNPVGELARENIETAFLYADASKLAYFAEILGREDDRAALMKFADQVRDNYNARLMAYDEAHGRWCYRVWEKRDALVMTQATQALPLYWGMVPEDRVADVAASLKYVLERDQSFLCGEIGLPYVIQCASRYGMDALICRFILKETHPSYYAFILDGETTLGEYWETNPRSHCHDMMGHIIEWYYNGCAGIKPLKPGFREVLIQPYMPESVNELSCTYNSVSGPISVRMKREGGRVKLRADVADGIKYTVDESKIMSPLH